MHKIRYRRVVEHLSGSVRRLSFHWIQIGKKFLLNFGALSGHLHLGGFDEDSQLFAVDHNINGIRTETDVLLVSRCAQNSLQDENEFYANMTLSCWRTGRNSGRPFILPNRHGQDASPVLTGIREGWRFSRHLQRCGKCGRRERTGRYVLNYL